MGILMVFGGYGWLKTKPICSFCVLGAAYCVIDLSFPWKRESSLLGSYGFRIKCGMTCLVACFTEFRLKKQSQLKPIYSYCVLRDAYCENQFEKTKPILVSPKTCS